MNVHVPGQDELVRRVPSLFFFFFDSLGKLTHAGTHVCNRKAMRGSFPSSLGSLLLRSLADTRPIASWFDVERRT